MIGAGSAGLAAAARLKAAGVSVLVLEANDRVGGRAHTLHGPSDAALDMGCGWLHSADQNEWARLAGPMGFTIDHAPAAWTKPSLTVNFPADDQAAYQKVFEAFEARLAQAAESEADVAASTLIQPDERCWAPLLNAFSGYYNGAPFDRISVKDYAAYQPTDENWRVRKGYGAMIAAFAADLDVRLNTPVTRVEHGGADVRVVTAVGAIKARAAILAVSTTVLADSVIAFDPPLPDKREAAFNLPLGHVEKAFLKLLHPKDWPEEQMLHGRIDSAETGGYTFRPLGMPVIEGFYGGDLAETLEGERSGAFCAFAIEELAAVLGSDFRKAVEPLAESAWRADPFIRGAYSHARVGWSGARAILAAPVGDRLFFAGEACSLHAFSTAHGAYETGVVAAEAALRVLRP